MRKKNFLSYVAGFLTAAALFGFCVPTLAASIQKQITATYKDIKLYVDGKEVVPKDAGGNVVEPFVSNGTTYLPVRAVGEALGKEVTWDGTTNTVYIGQKPNTEDPTPEKPIDSTYNRTNPAPVGTEQTISISKYGSDYTVSIKIIDAFRGIPAWSVIREANRFNDPAPAGKEYVLFAVTATVESADDDKSVNFSKYDFTAFSSSNAEYERIPVVLPDPEFDGSAFAGGTIEGWVVATVDVNDEAPKVVYGQKSDGSGGIWFSLG